MHIKAATSTRTFEIIGYTFISILSILCVIPFILVISGSFTSDAAIIKYGYSLWPSRFSLSAYQTLFEYPQQILASYKVSIIVTAVGTVCGTWLMSMAGYVLQRPEVKYRNGMAFLIYFTTLFSGGLIPWYVTIMHLGLKNTLAVLILPGVESAFSILLVRNFMKSIPESLIESAKIDGGGDFLIYWKIVVPLSKPVLATIGLFLALGYWNDWFTASLFIQNSGMYPLQYLLYKTLQSAQVINSVAASHLSQTGSNFTLPTESLKLATAVVATGPIIILYPVVQRYFVKGITIGAVKG